MYDCFSGHSFTRLSLECNVTTLFRNCFDVGKVTTFPLNETGHLGPSVMECPPFQVAMQVVNTEMMIN